GQADRREREAKGGAGGNKEQLPRHGRHRPAGGDGQVRVPPHPHQGASMTGKLLSASAIVLALAAVTATSADEKKAPKRILLITESKGFRHGCVTRQVKATAEVDPKALAAVPGVRDVKVNKDKDGKVTSLTATYEGGGRIDPEKGMELKIEGKGVAVALPCVVEKAFADLAKESGDFEVVCSQAARKEITAENLKEFDAVFFYTTGDLGLSDVQKA